MSLIRREGLHTTCHILLLSDRLHNTTSPDVFLWPITILLLSLEVVLCIVGSLSDYVRKYIASDEFH